MRTKISVLVSLSLGMVAAASANAAPQADRDYYTVDQVETHEISDQLSSDAPTPLPTAAMPVPLPKVNNPAGGDGIDIGSIINVGKQIWDIVVSNQPVATIKLGTANALPKGISDWQDLAGWNAPQSRSFETNFKNVYGMNVVTFRYRVTYTAGGSYLGSGKYLTNVSVIPTYVNVAWGFKFDAEASVPNITNAGSAKAPLAAAEVLVTWTVHSVLSHQGESSGYYVRGDGLFQTIPQ